MIPSTASRLVNDDEVKELFAQLRADLLNDFASTRPENTEAMVRIRLMLQCLDGLWGRMESLAFDHRKQIDQPTGVNT